MRDQLESLELNQVKEQFIKHCSFSLGIKRIKTSSPHYDALWIKRELNRVKEAFSLVVSYGNLPFGGVCDLENSLANAMKDRILTSRELRQIAEEIRAIEHIENYFKASELETPYLQELIESFSNQVPCAKAIEKCISINEEIFDHASDELRTIRRSMGHCSQEISNEVQRFLSHNSAKLMDTITTIHNDRTCVSVKISEKNSIDGFIHGESASGQTAYIEPRSLLLLNNKYQSLKSQENNEIERILFELSQKVKEIAHELLGNLETLALLDELFAKALWAKEVDGCIAQLNTRDHHLYLKNAKHPLIDEKKVIANTYEIKEPFHSLLITGSNTGGKTVTLKTIGLFVEMTLCGMPIHAQEAIIPLFDSIYVDIGDDQSIQESLSTFSSHISKLSYITNHATKNSLVLLDELGSGTDPKEGEPLAVAVLDDLRMSGAMIIATTHFSALKHYASQNEDILLSSVRFDMEAMRPDYHYIEGIAGQSNAFEIARRYGLKESILHKAIEKKEENRSISDVEMEKLEKTLLENISLKEQLHSRIDDVKTLQESLEKEKSQFERQKEHRLTQLREEAQKKLEEKQEEAQTIIDQLKSLQADSKPHEVVSLKSQLAKLSEEEEEESIQEESFDVNDYVMIRKYKYYGEILSINKEKAVVLANGMKMNVSLQEITHAKKQKPKKKPQGYSSNINKNMSMECNVIGMHVVEAVAIVDKYLDNAILAHVSTVRLIHGMGTGALRKGIHDYLKHNPRVESYQMGGQGEGGLGATVVTLKQKGK